MTPGDAETSGREVPAADRELALRRRISADLGTRRKIIGWVRGIYGFHAVCAALVVFLILLLDPFGNHPIEDVGLALAGCATVCALFTVGAVQVRFQPLLWAVVLACVMTGAVVLRLMTGERALALAASAGLLWFCVPALLGTSRLIAENPDLYVAHGIRGTHLAPRRTGTRRAKDPSEILRAASKRAWRVSLATAAAIYFSTAVSFAVYVRTRAPRFDRTGERFVDAWSAGDAGAVAGFYSEESVERMERRIRRSFDARGWTTSLPKVSDWEVARPADRQVTMTLRTPEGDVVTYWGHDGGWRLEGIQLP